MLVNTIVVHQSDIIPILESLEAHRKCVEMLQVTKHTVIQFTVCRLLFYMSLNKKIAEELAHLHIYDLLFGVIP